MADPTYAPYVAYFRRYDADASNTISQTELAPLLREVGYCFSASVVRAVLAQYYPDAGTALKFSVRFAVFVGFTPVVWSKWQLCFGFVFGGALHF